MLKRNIKIPRPTIAEKAVTVDPPIAIGRISNTASITINPIKTFWANTNTTMNLTNKWRVSYRARFDLLQRDLINHSFSIYRDLHCWELSLNWTPNGIGQGINFKLNVKSPTLKDLKIEKKGGIYSGAGL